MRYVPVSSRESSCRGTPRRAPLRADTPSPIIYRDRPEIPSDHSLPVDDLRRAALGTVAR